MSKPANDIDDDIKQRLEYLRRKLGRIEASVDAGGLTPLHRSELNVKLADMGARLDELERGHGG